MPQIFIHEKSTLIQVMAWCRQTTSHHLKQCWPRFVSPYGIIITPLHRRWNGGILDSPRCLPVRLSVRPSVCRRGFRNFVKKLLAQLISYLLFTLMGWVSWPLFIFVFLASFLALWWPNIWPKMGFPELFEKNYWPNLFHTWHLPLWGESLDPYSFSCS